MTLAAGTCIRNAYGLRSLTLSQLGKHHEAMADINELAHLNVTPEPLIQVLRAGVLARASNYRRAMNEVDGLLHGKALPRETLYNLSCVFTLCAASVARDVSRPLPEREKQAETWARQAVEMLQRATTAGYFREQANRVHLDKDDDLAFLRDRDDFRAFIKTLPASKIREP